jgi:toxin ParE1/3/4
MTGRISFTPEAERQLNEIDDWIATAANANVARRFVSTILDHIGGIVTFPLAGRARDDVRPGMRTTTLKRRTVVAYLVEEASGQTVITVLGASMEVRTGNASSARSTAMPTRLSERAVPLACPIRTERRHSPQSQTDRKVRPSRVPHLIVRKGNGTPAPCPLRARSGPILATPDPLEQHQTA